MLFLKNDHPKIVMPTWSKPNGDLRYYLINFTNFDNWLRKLEQEEKDLFFSKFCLLV